ncbi:L-fucose isomerase [Abditibacterium utsteinense]|uniref:L-fucose isomerase n=1 Tax=Abditibacterium utsteinense TaxID=1960156 RepID=UPI003CC502B2
MNSPHNRLRTPLPKIGIRPTIDGRLGGVRESLEVQTMNMARATAKLIQNNLKHACGLEVEVVIADSTIGGVSEAAQCAAKFERQGVGVSLTVTPCWCYGSETMDMNPVTPKAVWGFNGTERPGAVYLAAALAGHAQKGLPAFGIYGEHVQDSDDTSIPDDVSEKILTFCRAGLAAATLRGTSYLAMGGTSMGISGSQVSSQFFEDYLGMRSEAVDMTEFLRRVEQEIYDHEEYELALSWVKANCPEGQDPNEPSKQRTREQKDADWEFCVKMALIGRDLMIGNPKLKEMGFGEESEGHNALAAGFQGQRQWTDHRPNGDFLEAILTSSFDWNGIRQPFMLATENDALNGAGMLFGHLLTQGQASLFADLRTYWSSEAVERVTSHKLEGAASGGLLHLINSGPAALDWTGEALKNGQNALKPWYQITPEEAQKCLDATKWCASDAGYFPAGGWSTDFTTRGDLPVTIHRLNLVKGLGPVLQIAEGFSVELPQNVHDTLDARTNPTWPTTWFAPILTGEDQFSSAYDVMNAWGANHCVASYGHIGADLLALAAILRIPVEMHNVPDERIFRPAAWNRFGGAHDTGADYRACTTYGPLYG